MLPLSRNVVGGTTQEGMSGLWDRTRVYRLLVRLIYSIIIIIIISIIIIRKKKKRKTSTFVDAGRFNRNERDGN